MYEPTVCLTVLFVKKLQKSEVSLNEHLFQISKKMGTK